MADSSEHSQRFIDYLVSLRERDTGAMACLRHSLAFEPGAYPRAYPYVERFAGEERHARDSHRLALYAVAALFARHPEVNSERSFPAAFATLYRNRNSESIERRFIAILDADADTIFDYLRHAISLLAADGIGLSYATLLEDLRRWLNRHSNLDHLRQRWARDFYRALETGKTNN